MVLFFWLLLGNFFPPPAPVHGGMATATWLLCIYHLSTARNTRGPVICGFNLELWLNKIVPELHAPVGSSGAKEFCLLRQHLVFRLSTGAAANQRGLQYLLVSCGHFPAPSWHEFLVLPSAQHIRRALQRSAPS